MRGCWKGLCDLIFRNIIEFHRVFCLFLHLIHIVSSLSLYQISVIPKRPHIGRLIPTLIPVIFQKLSKNYSICLCQPVFSSYSSCLQIPFSSKPVSDNDNPKINIYTLRLFPWLIPNYEAI
jgi:hypothetical protein